MFSLLAGLLFRPRAVMQQIVEKSSQEQSSRLNFLMVVLLMINTAFSVGIDPSFDTYLGADGKWVFALLFPPIQYWLHRLIFMISARLGLVLFAKRQVLGQDLKTQAANLLRVKGAFPYTVYPAMFFGIISLPFGTGGLSLLVLVGLIYTLVLTVFALKAIYGVSTAAAFFGPLIVQVVIFLLIGLLLMGLGLLFGLLGSF